MVGAWCRKQFLFGEFEVFLIIKLMIFERKYNNFTEIYTRNKYPVKNRDSESFI
jgi:hypothetical protein